MKSNYTKMTKMTPFYINFGEVVKRKREEKRMSATALAYHAGITVPTVADIESGKYTIKFHTALLICKVWI